MLARVATLKMPDGSEIGISNLEFEIQVPKQPSIPKLPSLLRDPVTVELTHKVEGSRWRRKTSGSVRSAQFTIQQGVEAAVANLSGKGAAWMIEVKDTDDAIDKLVAVRTSHGMSAERCDAVLDLVAAMVPHEVWILIRCGVNQFEWLGEIFEPCDPQMMPNILDAVGSIISPGPSAQFVETLIGQARAACERLRKENESAFDEAKHELEEAIKAL